MPTNTKEIKEAAAAYFENHPLGAEVQTRISLFLLNLKQANAMILAKNEFQPMDWVPYTLLHKQYYKEMELATLLTKSTQWSLNPLTYTETSQLSVNFWSRINAHRFVLNFILEDRLFFEYLALSHAFMSEVRFVPLFSADYSLENRFYAALYAIENENGRQIQTQIRFLKEMELPLSREEKENIVHEKREIVGELFTTLLTSVCQLKVSASDVWNPFGLWWQQGKGA